MDKTKNQCDGCQELRPRDENGNHRMGDGEYPDLMRCQEKRYVKQPLTMEDVMESWELMTAASNVISINRDPAYSQPVVKDFTEFMLPSEPTHYCGRTLGLTNKPCPVCAPKHGPGGDE